MTKKELLTQYRQKYGWEIPTKKLARIVYKENSILFPNLEAVRLGIMRLEGKGMSKRYKPITNMPNRPTNPYNIPQSYSEEREPFELDKKCNNILLISDLHIPYHNVDAITIAFEYGVKNGINTIIINGDLMDFHNLSRFEKDPRKRSVREEFVFTKQFLQSLRKTFPKAAIYWLLGNHDIRYQKWLMTKVYEIFDDEYYHLHTRLKISEENIQIIPDNVLVKAGKLSITHGHHIMRGFFSPVNSARGAWMKAKQSVIIGHVHKVSNHVEVNLDGESFGCWSTGSLCELKPDYNPLVSNYQHGFAHIVVNDDGNFSVKNYQIINGKIH